VICSRRQIKIENKTRRVREEGSDNYGEVTRNSFPKGIRKPNHSLEHSKTCGPGELEVR
jgi:hypothetical protein